MAAALTSNRLRTETAQLLHSPPSFPRPRGALNLRKQSPLPLRSIGLVRSSATTEVEYARTAEEEEEGRILRVGLICGGPSAERGISLNSARSVLDHIQVSAFLKLNFSPKHMTKIRIWSKTLTF